MGFGLVARRFVELLLTQASRLDTHEGLDWTIVGIRTARHGSAIAPDGIDPRRALASARDGSLTELNQTGTAPDDTRAFLDRVLEVVSGSPDRWSGGAVVVENTPLGLAGGQPGLDHVRIALAGGAHVITANKGPAAFGYRELFELAASTGRHFLFEGAVLDGLPVFSLLKQTLPTVRVRGFRGIVNTTTNHALSAMEQGQSLDAALADMQAAGVTEADPSNDVDGWDAAAKAAVLANALMGAELTPHDVSRTGLRSVSIERVNDARRRGRRLKLVATAALTGGGITASVQPVELELDDPLATLNGTAKGLEIDTDMLGTIQISKSRSGVDHTAYALLADLVTVHRATRQETD